MHKIILLAVSLLGMGLVSCHNGSRLASSVSGSWSGTPERVNAPAPATVTMTDVYDFTPDDSPKPTGGSIIISSQISVELPMQGDQVNMDYALTAAATSSITGVWDMMGDDDDEISVSLDPKTLTVSVDPEAVELRSNILDGAQTPQTDSITAEQVARVRAIATDAARRHLLSIRKLDDVEVSDRFMTFEIDDIHIRLNRQGPVSK